MSIFLGAIKSANQPLKAINKGNQKILNRAIDLGMQYYRASDIRDRAYDNDDTKTGKIYDRKAENIFNRYLNHFQDLPKAEQKRVNKYTLDNYYK